MAEKTQKKVPKIRFKGFFGEWEKKFLGDFVDITTGKLDANAMVPGGKYDFYTSGVKKYKINTVAFEGPAITVAGNGATVGYMHFADGKFNAYQRTYVLTNFKASRRFLYFGVGSVLPRKISEEARTGNIPYIVLDMLTDLELCVPNQKEQTQIGSYFSELDRLIGLHQRKHEKLVTLKKAMLKKMFPAPGATVPEIRFKGFSKPWKEEKLGAICGDTYGGGTPRTAEKTFWNGDIAWIQSSDLTSDQLSNVAPRKYITEGGLRSSATKLVPENSIAIVTRVGVGKLAFIPHKFATSQDFLSLSTLRIDAWYAVYSIWKVLQSKLHTVQGTSIKGLTKEELLSMQLLVPEQESEQQKIGTYFRQLDELIAQHGTQIEKLKQLKAACLEKMFV